MTELKNTTELVKQVLEEKPATRNSDNLLYVEVIKYFSKELEIDIGGFPFCSVLKNMSKWGIPSIETVGRCRRKLQQLHPELRADAEVEGFRSDRQEAFREWAGDHCE